MSSVRTRKDNGLLLLDFRYQGKRCREQTMLKDTAANRKRLQKLLDKIDAEITLGTFEYRQYFPNSKRAAEFDPPPAPADVPATGTSGAPLFRHFADTWWHENEVHWRHSTSKGYQSVLRRYLLPTFGDRAVDEITKADILGFRAEIAQHEGRSGNQTLTPKTINLIMGMLSMIMTEASDRYSFVNPMRNLKRLRQQRKDIHPFSLAEVRQILNTVRSDYYESFAVRFFTGMRSGEIHGLKWQYVDWNARQILVRETYGQGRTDYTKTDGSQREITMSSTVLAALQSQYQRTGDKEYVFCTRDGTPLDSNNVARRVWYPLLRYLGMTVRRPYQTRHTAATLWLAAGENPEFIARQMGHTTTEMLFRVYSRYVPNLTRQDGSAFDQLVANALNGGTDEE